MFTTMYGVPVTGTATCFGGTVTIPAPKPLPANDAQQKGKPMCYDYDEQPTVENRKLSHVQNRLSSIRWKKQDEMRKMFKIDPDYAPRTGKELIARIKDGKYQLRDEQSMKNTIIWSIFDYFIWREPGVEPDHDGYKLAEKELNSAYESALDAATLLDAKGQLEAIADLESWTPSNAPKHSKK